MTTRRMIHASYFDSLDTAEWTLRQRYLVIGMIASADDQGRVEADPRLLKIRVFPFDPFTPMDVQEDLEHIAGTGNTAILYEADGRQYVQFRNWWEYQQLQWAKPSEWPAPDGWCDRIRQLQYRPSRWIMTKNWPDTADRATYEDKPVKAEEHDPKVKAGSPIKANRVRQGSGNALPNALPNEPANFNINPYSYSSVGKGDARGKTNDTAPPFVSEVTKRMQAMFDVCGLDARVPAHVRAVEGAAAQLDSYTGDEIRDRFERPSGPVSGWNWYIHDFRGKKGDQPTPRWVVENISKAAPRPIAASNGSSPDSAWAIVEEALSKGDGRLLIEHPAVLAAVDATGGWVQYKESSTRDRPFLKKAFIGAYHG